jgi:serine/threonine protein kinase
MLTPGHTQLDVEIDSKPFDSNNQSHCDALALLVERTGNLIAEGTYTLAGYNYKKSIAVKVNKDLIRNPGVLENYDPLYLSVEDKVSEDDLQTLSACHGNRPILVKSKKGVFFYGMLRKAKIPELTRLKSSESAAFVTAFPEVGENPRGIKLSAAQAKAVNTSNLNPISMYGISVAEEMDEATEVDEQTRANKAIVTALQKHKSLQAVLVKYGERYFSCNKAKGSTEWEVRHLQRDRFDKFPYKGQLLSRSAPITVSANKMFAALKKFKPNRAEAQFNAIERDALAAGGFGSVHASNTNIVVSEATVRINEVNEIVKKQKLRLEDDVKEQQENIRLEADKLNHFIKVRGITSVRAKPSDLDQNNYVYITMDRVPGRSLDQFDFADFSFEKRMDILLKICTWIDTLHTSKVNRDIFMHCDLKPQNIMYDPDTDSVGVIDFGLSETKSEEKEAKRDAKAEEENRNLRGFTWGYFCPTEKVSPEADVYALSAIIAQVLGCSYDDVMKNKLQCRRNGEGCYSSNAEPFDFSALEDIPFPEWVDEEDKAKLTEDFQEYLAQMGAYSPQDRPPIAAVINFFSMAMHNLVSGHVKKASELSQQFNRLLQQRPPRELKEQLISQLNVLKLNLPKELEEPWVPDGIALASSVEAKETKRSIDEDKDSLTNPTNPTNPPNTISLGALKIQVVKGIEATKQSRPKTKSVVEEKRISLTGFPAVIHDIEEGMRKSRALVVQVGQLIRLAEDKNEIKSSIEVFVNKTNKSIYTSDEIYQALCDHRKSLFSPLSEKLQALKNAIPRREQSRERLSTDIDELLRALLSDVKQDNKTFIDNIKEKAVQCLRNLDNLNTGVIGLYLKSIYEKLSSFNLEQDQLSDIINKIDGCVSALTRLAAEVEAEIEQFLEVKGELPLVRSHSAANNLGTRAAIDFWLDGLADGNITKDNFIFALNAYIKLPSKWGCSKNMLKDQAAREVWDILMEDESKRNQDKSEISPEIFSALNEGLLGRMMKKFSSIPDPPRRLEFYRIKTKEKILDSALPLTRSRLESWLAQLSPQEITLDNFKKALLIYMRTSAKWGIFSEYTKFKKSGKDQSAFKTFRLLEGDVREFSYQDFLALNQGLLGQIMDKFKDVDSSALRSYIIAKERIMLEPNPDKLITTISSAGNTPFKMRA